MCFLPSGLGASWKQGDVSVLCSYQDTKPHCVPGWLVQLVSKLASLLGLRWPCAGDSCCQELGTSGSRGRGESRPTGAGCRHSLRHPWLSLLTSCSLCPVPSAHCPGSISCTKEQGVSCLSWSPARAPGPYQWLSPCCLCTSLVAKIQAGRNYGKHRFSFHEPDQEAMGETGRQRSAAWLSPAQLTQSSVLCAGMLRSGGEPITPMYRGSVSVHPSEGVSLFHTCVGILGFRCSTVKSLYVYGTIYVCMCVCLGACGHVCCWHAHLHMCMPVGLWAQVQELGTLHSPRIRLAIFQGFGGVSLPAHFLSWYVCVRPGQVRRRWKY